MSEQIHRTRRDEPEPEAPDLPGPAAASDAAQRRDEGLDDLLDEIDDVLEVNAEEFVRSFVQKGGQ
ncbi:MAG TPA: ubiquitin-like protein Pup [Candidatus Avipropionibacterium avicola]|uniref:Prokaryotic ubiquitin-like protein Pup n=1 Tax=Candidatus Avipropionibacterium avicola TaxID=2840701 RepID=A0A9D1GZ65_9ACTN|nr:ubiquitin-like protein Pup [Candidatus Avipropionibacterium avicola]